MDKESKAVSGGKVWKTLLYLCLVAGLVGVLIFLSAHPQEQPPMPADKDHINVADWKDCLICHGPGTEQATGPRHPISNERCHLCHQVEGREGRGRAVEAK